MIKKHITDLRALCKAVRIVNVQKNRLYPDVKQLDQLGSNLTQAIDILESLTKTNINKVEGQLDAKKHHNN